MTNEPQNNIRDGVLSPVSSAESKKSSKSSSTDQRIFERLNVSSIQYFAESLGYDTHYRKFHTIVSSDALCALTEDLNYRLRELIHKSVIFMRQRRGEKLSIGDLNEALRWSGSKPLLGHGSRAPPSLHFVKELNVFVPNEGIVDAPASALGSFRRPADPAPILSGHLLTSPFSTIIPSDSDFDQLMSACANLVKRCISCARKDFEDCLRSLRETCTIHPRCASILLNHFIRLITESPTKERSWHCLRHIIVWSDFKTEADGLNQICKLSKMLTDSILRPSTSPVLSSSLTNLHFRLLASISIKYDFLSSLHFGHALIRSMENASFDSLSTIDQSRILRALARTVDVELIFSNIDVIIDRFVQWIRVDDDAQGGDNDMRSVWKSIIDALVRTLLRNLHPRETSKYDGLIAVLVRLISEAFGDASPVPLVDYHRRPEHVSIDEPPRTIDRIIPKSGAQFLDEYWNAFVNKRGESSAEPSSTESKPIVAPRRRKRRRDASDVFEVPKRFRLMHQRDIIFVFHRTQAVVRPLQSTNQTASIGSEHSRWRIGDFERRGDRLLSAVLKRRRRSISSNTIERNSIVADISSLIL